MSDAPYSGSSNYHDEDSPQQSPLDVGMVGDSGGPQGHPERLHRSGYENVDGCLPNRPQHQQLQQQTSNGEREELEEIQR